MIIYSIKASHIYACLFNAKYSTGNLVHIIFLHLHHLALGNRELKHATFLSHGRQPEVNISHARKVVSQIFKLIVSTSKKRLKTESARRWSNKWTKILYQDYLHCIANFCRALLILSSQNKSFLATPNVEYECWTSYETHKSFGEMKFCLCFHKITELWNLFSLVPVGNYFSVLFQAIIYVFSFKKM